MAKYLTIELFKAHSRIDAEDETYLTQCLDAAEEALKHDLQADDLSDVEVDGELPKDLLMAGLIGAGTLYDNREALSPVQLHSVPVYWKLVKPHIIYNG